MIPRGSDATRASPINKAVENGRNKLRPKSKSGSSLYLRELCFPSQQPHYLERRITIVHLYLESHNCNHEETNTNIKTQVLDVRLHCRCYNNHHRRFIVRSRAGLEAREEEGTSNPLLQFTLNWELPGY